MAHAIIVGAGAIGSHLLPHLARSRRVSRLTVIDRDKYESANLSGQDVDARDVGRPKAVVQARRLRRINPALVTRPIYGAVEDLPLGALRGDVILGCLDSRVARMTVSQAAWRLGVPFVDAGIEPTGLLARVAVFVPGPDAACVECAWDAADYAALEQSYPCLPDAAAPRTAASSALGGVAGALQAIECDKLLAGANDEALIGRELLIDARHHTHYVSAARRNPACRMPDHSGWRIDPFGGAVSQTTLGDLLAIGTTLRDAADGLAFRVAGQRFATALACSQCGTEQAVFQLERALRHGSRQCAACRGELRSIGFALHEAVTADATPDAALNAPLATLGLRAGDVFSLSTRSVDAHYELGGEA
jgi:molybdopterin/thiamine biosynthesis adenylyltransferase